jgi:hypothetical protein
VNVETGTTHGTGPSAARRSTALRRLTLPLLAAVAALLLLAPTAMGTRTTDDQFLADWHAAGMYATSDQAAIDAGRAIVAFLDAQPTFDGISRLADDIVHATGHGPGLVHYTYYEAGEQLYLAVYYYGPAHLPLLNAYTDTNRSRPPGSTVPALPNATLA